MGMFCFASSFASIYNENSFVYHETQDMTNLNAKPFANRSYSGFGYAVA
jgi:hypothetical protein